MSDLFDFLILFGVRLKQLDAAHLQLRSAPLTKSIVMMRIKLATQTLQKSDQPQPANYKDTGEKYTHKAPRAKMPDNASF